MTNATSSSPTTQRVSLWHHRGFMLFWSGETISMFGSQVTLLALPLTAVLTLHATPEQLGWVRFLELAPYILFALLLGAWTDRQRRRPVLILANSARCVLLMVIPLLAALHMLSLTWLAVVAFCAGSFTVLFEVTWTAFIPILVPKTALVEANGRMATSSSAAEVVGPGFGGLLVQIVTAPFALFVDALSYLVATLTLLNIHVDEPLPQTSVQSNLGQEIAEGLHFVIDNSYLRAIALMSGFWNFFAGIGDTIFLLYAITSIHIGPGMLGTIIAFGAVGGLVGAAISTTMAQRSHFGPLLGIAFVFGCVPWIFVPAVQSTPLVDAAVIAPAFFAIHLGLGIWLVLVVSLRQALSPGHLMGRTGAGTRLISYGLGALGSLASGFLGAAIGLRPTLWLAAIGFLVILAITLTLTPLPRLRSLPEKNAV